MKQQKNVRDQILSCHRWNHEDRVCYRTRSHSPLSAKARAAVEKDMDMQGENYSGPETIVIDGKRYIVYQTLLVNGKAISCTCPATKPCYHETQLEAKHAQEQQLRREREEFPYGLTVAMWDGMMGTVVSEPFVNNEGIHGVLVAIDNGDVLPISIADLCIEQDLARITEETLAHIAAEEAATPAIGKSEQARLADLPFSESEKKYANWGKADRAALGNNRHVVSANGATPTLRNVDMACFMR